jgi:PIN domain
MFLDTSGLFRLFHRPENGHAEANELFNSVDWALTHSYVLAEFVALATARGVPRREALAAFDAILAIAYIEVVWVDETLHRRAMAFLHQRIPSARLMVRSSTLWSAGACSRFEGRTRAGASSRTPERRSTRTIWRALTKNR